jgi:hypothetical protein
VGLISTSEAARVISEGVGRPIKPRNVQDAARRGRLQAKKAGGPRSLIEEADVLRVLTEAGKKEER